MDEATHTEFGEDARFRRILTSPPVLMRHVKSHLLQLYKEFDCYNETLEDFSRFLSFAAFDIATDGEARSFVLQAIHEEEILAAYFDCVFRGAARLESDDWREIGPKLQVVF